MVDTAYGGTEARYGGAEVGHYIIMEAQRHGVQEQMLDMAYGATGTWCGRGADVVLWAWNYRNEVWTGSRCGTATDGGWTGNKSRCYCLRPVNKTMLADVARMPDCLHHGL